MAGEDDERTFQGAGHPTGSSKGLDNFQILPQVPLLCETEEILEKIEKEEYTQQEIILVSCRCVIAFICLLSTILVIIVTARGRLQRYKSWRLYILTSLMVLTWMCLSLYEGIQH